MAQAYIRQSTFADGDTITAALFNDEYNQLVNAFAYSSSSASSTGHRHDGTAGQGGNIFKIGDLDFLNKVEIDSSNNRVGFYVEVSSAAVEQVEYKMLLFLHDIYRFRNNFITLKILLLTYNRIKDVGAI